MSGIGLGQDIGQQWNQGRQRREDRKVYTKAFDEAKSAREGEIASQIGIDEAALPEGMAQPDASPLGQVVQGARSSYTVDGKNYGKDKTAARGAAEKDVDSILDFYTQVGAPQVRDHYLKTGRADAANSWDGWIQDQNVQKGMRHWAQALRAAQLGDAEGFGQALVKAYNTPGYYEDGMEVVGDPKAIKQNGEISGYELTFKDADGQTFTQKVGMDNLYQVGIGMLEPKTVFETGMAQLSAAQGAQAKDALSERDHQRELELARVRASGGGKAPADVQKAEWLLTNGVAQDADQAWQLANMSTAKGRQGFALEYAKMLTDSQGPYAKDRKSPREALDEGLALYDELNKPKAQPQPRQAWQPTPGAQSFLNPVNTGLGQ